MNYLNHKNRLSTVLSLLLVLFVGSAFAQETTVTGNITQKSTGEAIIGATVVVKGTTIGTVTDIDGNYSIKVNAADAVLQFSSIGYTKTEVTVNNQSVINVQLETDVISLENVVVIGYGTIKKNDVTGSVASMDSDDLLSAPIVSLDAGMQGRMAGVTLQKTSGAPGQAMKMRIRGGGSINYNNSPLYVIDGFIGGDMTNVNPNDIERIDILKDASATAIYGSRGANGVVLVTTKTAKKGDFKIALDATYGMSNIVKSYEMLDAGTSAEYWNLRLTAQNELSGQNAPLHFTDEELTYFKENGGENYLDLITRTATTQNYNLSMSGGSDKITYMLSGGYLNEEGIVDHSFRKKFSVRSNVSAEVKPWLDIKFNTYASHSDYKNNSQNNRAIMDAYMYPVFWANQDENGKYIFSGNTTIDNDYYVNGALSGFNGVAQPGEGPNPVWYNEARANGANTYDEITSSIDLNFKFTEHLELKLSGSGRYYHGYQAKLPLPDGVNVKSEADMVLTHQNTQGQTLINTSMLTYKNEIDDHNFSVQAMHEYSQGQYRGTIASVDSLATISNSWYMLGNGNPKESTSTFSESYMQSYMGRANYSYASKYLFTATIRVDQTSVFSEENRTGYFPSFAAGWVASQEDFLQSTDWISNLKVRAGYGETGNQAVGAYATQTRLLQPTGYAGFGGNAVIDGSTIVSGVLPQTTLVSPDLRWETTAQTNLGVDFSILDGKISMVADLYSKTTKDVILKRSVSMYNGRESVTDNYGTINNKGFEFMVDWRAIEGSDFNMNISANTSINRNEVMDLGGEESIFLNESLTSVGMWGYDNNNVFIIKQGESMGLLYGIKQTGLWQEDEAEAAAAFGSFAGMPKYEDLNGDSKIDANDRQVIGNTQPAFTYGVNLDLNYKNFSVFLGGIGSVGNDIYNYNRHYMDKRMLNPDYANRWSATNTSATQQRLPVGTEPANTYVASQYVEDGTFFKINNLTLSYDLPSNMLSQIGIGRLNVFGSVNNLLTITKYSGIDPENSTSSINSDSQAGIDSFSYPLARTITFGLKATF